MEFRITSPDPFKVLESTKPVVESLKYVKIHEENLEKVSEIILQKLKNKITAEDMQFGSTENLKDDVQLIFLEDAVNFCFWAEKEKDKWTIEWPKGNFFDGWFALTKCFQRALAQNIPILNAEYLENLSLNDTKKIFLSANKTEIPLLEKRMKNLQEAGRVLLKKYDGKFINVLEQGEFDAIKIVQLLIQDFSSFRDIAKWNNEEIYFLKRAQICALDLSYLKKIKIKNIDCLTGFADYKVPQILREFGVISYNQELANKIDNYILISKESREEIEIRSATIWCIELIKQKLQKYSAGDIDNSLWLISQNKIDVKPYHRAYNSFY